MINFITASMLYDLLRCPHRVSLDVFADHGDRGEISPFVRMLWEKGSTFEKELMGNLGKSFLDLSNYAGDEKEQQTIDAMKRGEPLIYSARISSGELLGNPDLLRKEKVGYAAIDIKSGAGLENKEDLSKPKKHYSVQLALYTDILARLGLSAGNYAYIWDIDGDEILYDFKQPFGARSKDSMWDFYQSTLSNASAIVGKIAECAARYCRLSDHAKGV